MRETERLKEIYFGRSQRPVTAKIPYERDNKINEMLNREEPVNIVFEWKNYTNLPYKPY